MSNIQHTSTDTSTFDSTYGKKKKMILLYLQEHSTKHDVFNSNHLAELLRIKSTTVRYYLNELSKKGLIFKQRVGKITNFYIDNTQIKIMKRMNPQNKLLPKIHCLDLYIEGLSSTDRILGIKCKCGMLYSLDFQKVSHSEKSGLCLCPKKICSIRNNLYYYDVWMNKVHISMRFGKEKKSCQIYLRCTNNPIDYFEFVSILDYLEGYSGILIWENLDKWLVKQSEASNDVKSCSIDAFHFDCTLHDFGHVLARVYEKEFFDDYGERVKGFRFEVNEEIAKKLSTMFFSIVDSSLDVQKMMQINTMIYMKMEELVDYFKESNKKQVQQDRELDYLRKKISNLEEKEKLNSKRRI